MKRLDTAIPFEVYKNLADSKKGFDGDQEFIDLLIPALNGLSDDSVLELTPQ